MSRLPLDQLKQVFSLEALSLSTLFNSQDTEQQTEAASEGVLTHVSVLTSANIPYFYSSLVSGLVNSLPLEVTFQAPPLGLTFTHKSYTLGKIGVP